MTYKCKICGGQATIDSNNGVVVCDYCGTKQALPLFTADSERLLYDRGNNYLLHSEYDKAENVFNQLLTIKPGAAELYWDLVLCKYGVTYVKDPKAGKYIPTCNRTHYTPIFSDENYKKAIELSAGEKKALFEEDAKTIDNIQKGIIAVSKKEKPFDIFISYKETDANGNRTKDSIEAQKLYEKLTEAGYKVFFSRVTLEDKIGAEYEPYIYAALYSSKVMLTICSSKENIEAVWVKNEWSRFLGFRQNDNSKTLLPLYFGMDKAELPEEFALLSAYDIHTDGFEDELLRGIKKLIPLPIMKAKRRKQILKATGIVAACLVLVLGILAAIIIPKKLEEKRLAQDVAANEQAYQAAMTLFDNADYTSAEAAFIALGDYKDSAHMAARCPIQPDYDAAMQLYYDGKYAQATWAFEALGDYEDAAEQKKKAELSWRKSLATPFQDVYFINENGTVSTIKGKNGSAHNYISNNIAKNGKAVSIIQNSTYSGKSKYLTALYEKGSVSHPDMEAELINSSEWHDIVKVSDYMDLIGMIGLRADGKMVILSAPNEKYANDLTCLTEWIEIVDFQHTFEASGQALRNGLVVGLKADGTFCVAQLPNESVDAWTDKFDMAAVNRIFEKFQNVQSFSVYSDWGGMNDLAIVALTNDNKLISYSNGEYKESDGSDICDIIAVDIVLKRNGDLVELSSGKVLLQDVVLAEGDEYVGYAITRTGSVAILTFYDEPTGVDLTSGKTIVYEEWISRLN